MRTITPMPESGMEIYDIDSGMGGVFTVSVTRELARGMVEVRIWYGKRTETGWQSYGLFDGKTFQTSRDKLTNRRRSV
ncbi:hypothetical protein J2T08_004303 [Neorhizobium galegae]|uniref:hypothetical protein n=1 Tax=Neorhizobium galegae TaxID=399 RepID=UPI001AE7A881|nr:hypothetical protein [Neorhizobium galegae]MBP2557673.1 hypothetical protein [Neorhizobium galegae]MDQ0136367.1 hypothetical protein [Neorhizobium galegae]